MRGFHVKIYISCLEELPLIGVTYLWFPRIKMKKEKSLTSLEEILCYGIKDWDMLERRVFNNYKVKVWLIVCLIAN